MKNKSQIVYGAPKYGASNEALRAVVAGMDINPSDRVLAVCGSGDVPFALLEGIPSGSSGSILAVDTAQVQVNYAKHKAECLKRMNLKGFMHCEEIGEWRYLRDLFKSIMAQPEIGEAFVADGEIPRSKLQKFLSLPRDEQNDMLDFLVDEDNSDNSLPERVKMRSAYFSERGRLNRIRGGLSNLEIEKGNVFGNQKHDGNARVLDAEKTTAFFLNRKSKGFSCARGAVGPRHKGLFDKIYLSNVVSYLVGRSVNSEETSPIVERVLNGISPMLKNGGIVYYCHGEFPLELPGLSSGWSLDEKLTDQAGSLSAKEKLLDYEWTPVVLRKKYLGAEK